MSIWIGLSRSSNYQDENIKYTDISLENNGYYWYMFPYFEKVRNLSKQMIDLYGNADFFGKDLLILEDALIEILSKVMKEKDEWDVKTGEQIHPKKKIIYDTVYKNDFKKLLEEILNAVKKAKGENKHLIFFGD